MGNGELRIHARNVQQGLGLKIENRRILGGVRDLQHVFSTIVGLQVKVLVALAHEPAGRTADAEEPLGNFLGFFDRKGRSLGFQHTHRFAIGCRGHDWGGSVNGEPNSSGCGHPSNRVLSYGARRTATTPRGKDDDS